VRSLDETREALGGGADVLDLKEPAHGSLGMARLAEIRAVAELARVPVTAALGETADWLDTCEFPSLPPQLACVKLGLAGMQRRSHWISDWVQVRAQFDAAAGTPLGWVAVAYADGHLADSPDIDAVIAAAAATSCRGVLIDTHSKSAGPLLTHVTIRSLHSWSNQVHAANLFLALAGRLSADNLPQLSVVPADVIAIRSAACAAGQRAATVSAACVATFKSRLEYEFSHAEDRGDRRRRAGIA
jgi:uncharacterized protein (UPF0264 family)